MLLDTQQIADLYKLHKNTIYKLVKSGMPVQKITNKIFRFDPNEIEAWFKNRK